MYNRVAKYDIYLVIICHKIHIIGVGIYTNNNNRYSNNIHLKINYYDKNMHLFFKKIYIKIIKTITN